METTQAFISSYQKGNVPQPILDQLMSMWVELSLPRVCREMVFKTQGRSFNPSFSQDSGGPLGALGNSGTIYTKSTKQRKKREAKLDNGIITEAVSYAGGQERVKREAASDSNSANFVDAGVDRILSREKRFLNFRGMTMGGPPGGAPKKEVSETAKMMKMLLMMSRLQKQRFSSTVSQLQPQRNDYYGERANFGGMYGDQYMGRKKREAPSASEINTLAESSISNTAADATKEPVSRKKRFLMGEPGDGQPAGVNPMSQFMGMLMGTARDPATGKKLDFGGDAMKNMMRRSFLSVLPPSSRPPPGKEPGDFVKAMAPLRYFSRLQRSMNPQTRMSMKAYSKYPMRMRTSGYTQKRNKDGTYGDAYPVGRKKRAADEDSDGSNSSPNNDVITFGDLTIPMEFFKPKEQADPAPVPPPQTSRPIYVPVYMQPRQQPVQRRQPLNSRAAMLQRLNRMRMINSAAAAIRQRYNAMMANRFRRPVAPPAAASLPRRAPLPSPPPRQMLPPMQAPPPRQALPPPQMPAPLPPTFGVQPPPTYGAPPPAFGVPPPPAYRPPPPPRSAAVLAPNMVSPLRHGRNKRSTQHRRVKRDNNEQTDKPMNPDAAPFFPSSLFLPQTSMFMPSWMSPYLRRSLVPNKMMVSNSATGGAIFGDRLPWASTPRRSSPLFSRSAMPPSFPRSATMSAAPMAPAPGLGPLDMIYGQGMPPPNQPISMPVPAPAPSPMLPLPPSRPAMRPAAPVPVAPSAPVPARAPIPARAPVPLNPYSPGAMRPLTSAAAPRPPMVNAVNQPLAPPSPPVMPSAPLMPQSPVSAPVPNPYSPHSAPVPSAPIPPSAGAPPPRNPAFPPPPLHAV